MPGLRKRSFIITPAIKQKIVEIIDERIREVHVTKEDFSELKAIVKELSQAQKELAEAQKRTEQRVEELAEAQKRTEKRVEELAEAQKRTEQKVEELAEAQKRTEQRVEELAEAQKRTEKSIQALTEGLNRTRRDLGGLSQSLGYAFENEAYRMVPKVLKEKYGIEVKERFVRAEIGGKEVNLFARAIRDGKEVLVVGEVKLGMDKRFEVFEDLEQKVSAVLEAYPDVEIVRVLVSHYVSGGLLQRAKEQGIIVIQSFEW